MTGIAIDRLNQDFMLDTSFHMYPDPLCSSLQGGDYYVYPDGRVLMGGVHMLHDTTRGYLGYYCLVWFTNTGYLDTTAHHRTCAGSLDVFAPLPNGQFIGSGSTGIWDGHQASNIIRFNADGSLDSTFQAHVWWGEAYGFLSLPDGRVYAGGNFQITGIPDTLQLVRLLPDGSLDHTFNNHLRFDAGDLDGYPGPNCIYPLNDGCLIVTGGFEGVDGQQRGGICMIDTNGKLLNDYFAGTGGGSFMYQGLSTGTVRGIIPSSDGSFFIWGSYHGYDDGTTNDTLQRMVSRLYGLNVGIHEQEKAAADQLHIAPNPSAGQTTLSLGSPLQKGTLTVHDASGRVVLQREWPAGAGKCTLEAGALAPGAYLVRVASRASATAVSAGSAARDPAGVFSRTGRLVVLP